MGTEEAAEFLTIHSRQLAIQTASNKENLWEFSIHQAINVPNLRGSDVLLDNISQQLQHAATDEAIVAAVKKCDEDMNEVHKDFSDELAASDRWILLEDVASSPFHQYLKQQHIQIADDTKKKSKVSLTVVFHEVMSTMGCMLPTIKSVTFEGNTRHQVH